MSIVARKAAELEMERARELRKKFLEVLEGAIENAETKGAYETEIDAKYSVREIIGEKKNYGQGVYLDTDVFDKIPVRKWGDKLRKYVYEKLAGSELTVYNDGHAETIYIAKINDRVKKDGAKNPHKVIDKLARYRNGDNTRSLLIVHIGELSEISKNDDFNAEHTHQWMDENGWEFRRAHIMDRRGKIYEATLNIAKGKERNILYDVNNIKEIDHGDVASKGLAHKNQSLNQIISKKKEKSREIVKKSLKVEVDSNGRNLSEEQMNYFADSKILTEDNKLKVMYHGSPEQFTIFDRRKAKSSGYYGRGFYFTDIESHAGQYGSK